MKNNKKSISTKIKSFVLGAIIVGVAAVTTVFSLTGCNTNTPNNPPTLSQPGDFDDNQNNNNQTNNNQNNNNENNNQNNNNQTNNNQNNNQTQQKTEAQKLKEAFDAFNIAVKEKVAAKTKTTPENVEVNYVTINNDGLLTVGCKTEAVFAEFAFKQVSATNLQDLSKFTPIIQESTLFQVKYNWFEGVKGCESDVEDALRDAGYIKSSDKVLSLSCSDVAISGAVHEQGKKIYHSNVDIVILNASGKATKTRIEIRVDNVNVFDNLDDADFVNLGSEQLNSDVVAKYYEMQNGIFNTDN